jgi:hypothetical protein
MSAGSITAGSTRPRYRRQTPTVWQALGRSIWRALERVGRRRAEVELRSLARRWEAFDPQLAATLREAARDRT